MKPSEYTSHDALGLADLVRRREVSAAELVSAAFDAIAAVNPRLNAVITPLREDAEAAARGPLPDGPFTGVPFLVKDLVLMVRGAPLRMGSRLFAGLVAPFDSELTARHRAAGLVLIGKTNTPELGFNLSTEPVATGPTRNPWDPARIAGGSSGGSAAAVAARIVPMAHGSDAGGSIRVPAACCGVVGLKPSRGRTPLGPTMGDALSGLGIEHGVTRSVRDCAALLDATSAPDPGARYGAPPPARPYLEEVRREPGRLRVAFSAAAPNGAPVAEVCRRALEKAAALCQALGHEVVEAAPAIDAGAQRLAFTTIFSAHTAFNLDVLAPTLGVTPRDELLETANLSLRDKGRAWTAVDFVRAEAAMNAVTRQVAGFFAQFDVLLTPALAQPPLPLGTLDANAPGLDAFDFIDRCFQFAPFCEASNVTGNPAISLPLYATDDGLPLGVQLVGRNGDESTLFRLAGQLEQAAPWKDRRPAICAG